MKPLFILISILFGFLSIQAQYDYPYDSGNHYHDNTPRLIIQKSRIMGWYVSDINGNRISDYYEQIRPYRQGRAAALDKIMGWCFISLDGKRCTDYYLLVDDFHEGMHLSKIKSWAIVSSIGTVIDSATITKKPIRFTGASLW
jgi:hypothetical protein